MTWRAISARPHLLFTALPRLAALLAPFLLLPVPVFGGPGGPPLLPLLGLPQQNPAVDDAAAVVALPRKRRPAGPCIRSLFTSRQTYSRVSSWTTVKAKDVITYTGNLLKRVHVSSIEQREQYYCQ